MFVILEIVVNFYVNDLYFVRGIDRNFKFTVKIKF
jgi:hypothetical protein